MRVPEIQQPRLGQRGVQGSLVGRLVCWSIGPSAGRSIGWSVGRLKNGPSGAFAFLPTLFVELLLVGVLAGCLVGQSVGRLTVLTVVWLFGDS